MVISKKQENGVVTLNLEGRLDTVTSPELEKAVGELSEADCLVIDLVKLDYISSAGLRVLLAAHKSFAKKGGMTVKNANEVVADIFDVTGFKNILNIQ